LEQLRIALILGARPQIIKSSILIRLLHADKKVKLFLIHTGQHYDYEMTKVFFEEFSLPDPAVNLDVGSDTHTQQTAKIMSRLEPALIDYAPNIVVVPGDTNSTLAGAITAAKMNMPVVHFEAGARSYDNRMPEEINRRLTDHCSTLLLTTTENCLKNLLREGISKNRIRNLGDTMYDVLLQQLPKAEKTKILDKLNVKPKGYFLLTLHRQENVDDPQTLRRILCSLEKLRKFVIVFPIHPRTYNRLGSLDLYSKLKEQKNLIITKPVGYQENIALIKNAQLVLTDSGGIQKESFWLKTPCVTLRESTEWIETVDSGANFLVGSDTDKIVKTVLRIVENKEEIDKKLAGLSNPFGDGKASKKIVDTLKSTFILQN
jgi:UDP-N-acetylglucosamine 2-epimerase